MKTHLLKRRDNKFNSIQLLFMSEDFVEDVRKIF
jgi:hypothetical protein